MKRDDDYTKVPRRTFLKTTAAAAGAAMLTSSYERALAATPDDGLDYRNYQPERMQYAKLGNTDLMCSRLVFGCGAALAGGKAVRLLERSFAQGVNFYDVGYDDYYKGSEKHLAPFWKRHRDEIWVTSKAPARVPGGGWLIRTTLYTPHHIAADITFVRGKKDKQKGLFDPIA